MRQELRFDQVEEHAPIPEIKTKPTVDLKAKMLLSRQQKEPLPASNNAKRMKTIEPDESLDSPSNHVQRPKEIGKPPLIMSDKRSMAKQVDQPRPDPRLEESACELVSYSE